MNKVIFVCLFLAATLFGAAQSKALSAAEVLKPVYAQAAAEGKNVLLIFHASWCGWCVKMDQSLQDASVRPLIDRHYVTTHLTVFETKEKKALENAGAMELLTANGGGENTGIPYWLVLDKNGKVLANAQYQPGKNSGCPANVAEVDYFISVLKKTSPLNDEHLKIVAQRFRMNEQ